MSLFLSSGKGAHCSVPGSLNNNILDNSTVYLNKPQSLCRRFFVRSDRTAVLKD